MNDYPIQPSQQGELDNLCGVYSLVNALAYLYDGRIRRKQLKLALIHAFKEKWDLEELLRLGMEDEQQLEYLIERVLLDGPYHEKYPVTVRKPFAKKKNLKIKDVIGHMARWLKNAKPAGTRIILISTRDHWTLVRLIDDTHFHFFDSFGYKTSYRTSFSFRSGLTRNRLYPHCIYYIAREI